MLSFTKKYPELAERSPVYAELRNLIDMAVAAAYIQQQDYCAKAGWKMDFFGNEQAFPVETYNIPKTVESAVNAIWQGQHADDPHRRRRADPGRRGARIRQPVDRREGQGQPSSASRVKPDLAKGQWWWD